MLTVEPELVERYVRAGKVRLVFRAVLNYGEHSERTSEAAACAGEQGRFWEMHALLFEKQDEVFRTNPAGLVDLSLEFASGIEGLDLDEFQQCMSDRRTLAGIKAADQEQRSRGIVFQPVFEIGEERLVGLQSIERFSEVIEAALE